MTQSQHSHQGAVNSYVRGSTLLLVGRVGAAALGIVTHVIIVRTLPKESFGFFAYGLSLASLLQTLSTLGLDRGLSRFVPIFEEQSDRDRALGTIVGIFSAVAAGLLVVFLALVGIGVVSGGSQFGLARPEVLILAFLAPVQAADNLLTGLFATIGDPKAIFFRRFLLTPLFRLAVVLVLIAGDHGSVFLSFGYLVTGTIGAALYASLCVRALRNRRLLSRSGLRSMRFPMRDVVLFSLPLFSTDLVALLFNSVDALLVARFHGPDQVAELRSVQPVIRLNQLVLLSFGIMFTPMVARLFAKSEFAAIRHLYWRTAAWVAVLSFPGLVLGLSVAAPFTDLLFGSRYSDAVVVMAILTVGYYFDAALGFNGVTLTVFGHVRPVVVINLLAIAVNLSLNLALIPTLGAQGAAVATAATLIFQNMARHVVLMRRVGIPFVPRDTLPVYAWIAGAAAAVLLIQMVIDPPVAVSLGLAAGAWLVVVAAARRQLDISEAFPALANVRFLRPPGART